MQLKAFVLTIAALLSVMLAESHATNLRIFSGKNERAAQPSVCLGLLAIQVPGSVIMGESTKKVLANPGGAGFQRMGTQLPGYPLSTHGARVAVWNLEELGANHKQSVAEIKSEGEEFVQRSRTLKYRWLEHDYKDMVKFLQDRVRDNPGAASYVQNNLATWGKEAADVRSSIAATGTATLPPEAPPTGFAYRWGNNFAAGFQDPKDKRIRIITGAVSRPELGVQAAAHEWQSFHGRFSSRRPEELPQQAGVCTAFGFVADDPQDPTKGDYSLDIPFFVKAQPNLVFELETWMVPAESKPRPDIRDGGDPHVFTAEDLSRSSGVGFLSGIINMAGISHSYGPIYVNVAGQVGRIIGRRYAKDSGMDVTYEFEFMAHGVPGQRDKPYIKLTMAGVLPGKYRTAIGNKQPPKFKEAEEVFRKMVGSMRLHSPVPPAH